MSEDARERGSGLPRGLLILTGLAAGTIAVAGLKAISGVAAPAILALVLVITVYPIRDWLTRHRVPGIAASVATVLTVYLVLLGLVLSLVLSAGRLAALVPGYAPQFNDLVDKVGTWLRERGVSQDQINEVLHKLDVGQLVSVATMVFSSVLSVLTNLFFIAMLVLFAGFDAARFAKNLGAARGARPEVVDAFRAFAHSTRRYFAVSAGFGLICAVLDSAALWWLGVPAALVWGVLSFVTNFIPNIGFFIGLVPPAVLALLALGTGQMIVVIVAYVLINFVVQSVIQPKFVGDALGLTATLAFLSLVFWAFVLGPLGAILALPMTMLVKALLVDVDPDAHWLEPLLSGADVDKRAAKAAKRASKR